MKREEKLNQMIEELKNVCNDIGLDYMEYLDSINFTLKIYEENNSINNLFIDKLEIHIYRKRRIERS